KVDGERMMQQAIQKRSGKNGVVEDLTPCAVALVAGEDHRSFLVAFGHEFEEQMRTQTIQRGIADFIADEQLRLEVNPQFLDKASLLVRLNEFLHHVLEADKVNAIPTANGLRAKSHRQVCLADTG